MKSTRWGLLGWGLALALQVGVGWASSSSSAVGRAPATPGNEGGEGAPVEPAPVSAEPALPVGAAYKRATVGGMGSAIPSGDFTPVVAAAVLGGAGLVGAVALRKKAPQLSRWLGEHGLAPAGQVNVVAVRQLGSGTSLAVVEVYGERLVLAVSPTGVSLLTRVDGQPTVAPMTSDTSFANVLATAIDEPAPRSRHPYAAQEDDRGYEAEATPEAPSGQALSAALQEALMRKQQARQPAAPMPARAPRPTAPPPTDWRSAPAAEAPRPMHRAAAPAPTRQATPAFAAPEAQGAAGEVVRRLQTMRRFR